MKRSSVSHGFALLEVMIALTVFTLVGFSLVMALDTSLDAARQRNEVEAALQGISNQLALVRGGPLSPIGRDLPDDGSGIRYHLAIEIEQAKDQKGQPVPGLFRVYVVAKWRSGLFDEERSASEVLYQP